MRLVSASFGLMCFNVASPRDLGPAPRADQEEMWPLEPEIAPDVSVLSAYHQEKELSAMVDALSQVVAGEPESVVEDSPFSHVTSSDRSSPSSPSSGSKRGREEVLQYYHQSTPTEFGGYSGGERLRALSSAVRTWLLLLVASMFFSFFVLGS